MADVNAGLKACSTRGSGLGGGRRHIVPDCFGGGRSWDGGRVPARCI